MLEIVPAANGKGSSCCPERPPSFLLHPVFAFVLKVMNNSRGN
jgi:hypothetical protein